MFTNGKLCSQLPCHRTDSPHILLRPMFCSSEFTLSPLVTFVSFCPLFLLSILYSLKTQKLSSHLSLVALGMERVSKNCAIGGMTRSLEHVQLHLTQVF